MWTSRTHGSSTVSFVSLARRISPETETGQKEFAVYRCLEKAGVYRSRLLGLARGGYRVANAECGGVVRERPPAYVELVRRNRVHLATLEVLFVASVFRLCVSPTLAAFHLITNLCIALRMAFVLLVMALRSAMLSLVVAFGKGYRHGVL